MFKINYRGEKTGSFKGKFSEAETQFVYLEPSSVRVMK